MSAAPRSGLAHLAGSMSEAALQAAIVGAMQAQGWLVFHAQTAATVARGRVVHRTPQVGDRGFPDLACVHPGAGRSLVAELKAQRGRLAPEQVAWLDAYRAAGAEVFVWYPLDWVTGEIQRIIAPAWRSTAPNGTG